MYCVSVGPSSGLRCAAGFVAALMLLIFAADQADARPRKRGFFKRPVASPTYEPRYADIVVDANTGDVLHGSNADSQRHPASLTKVMTLYLLFERIEAGKLRLDSQLPVSAEATTQAPTKLGVKAGQTISVEDAIKALVTKSANDIAVVVAEALGGSEEEFAKLMTRKARALRMSRTVYKNASGLPDDDQLTTARDQALLALAIQDRFPRYYRYFATETFAYRGMRVRNHNRLLGRVDGVDGIKTGYTRASGFNLVTSVKRGDRHLVAVVLGGKSAGLRDARMRELIEKRIMEASVKRTAPKIAEAPEQEPQKPVRMAAAGASVPAKPDPAKPDTAKWEQGKAAGASARPEPTPVSATTARAVPAPSVTEPIKPRLVKTLSVKPGGMPLAVAPLLSPEPITAQAPVTVAPSAREETLPSPPLGARPGVLGVLPAREIASAPARDVAARKDVAARELSRDPAPELVVASAPAKPVAPPRENKPRTGWIIQVGAFPDENEAKQHLAAARSKAAELLGKADPFTEPVTKGDQILYRARFAGLKPEQAEAVCRQLKRSDIACIAIRN